MTVSSRTLSQHTVHPSKPPMERRSTINDAEHPFHSHQHQHQCSIITFIRFAPILWWPIWVYLFGMIATHNNVLCTWFCRRLHTGRQWIPTHSNTWAQALQLHENGYISLIGHAIVGLAPVLVPVADHWVLDQPHAYTITRCPCTAIHISALRKVDGRMKRVDGTNLTKLSYRYDTKKRSLVSPQYHWTADSRLKHAIL